MSKIISVVNQKGGVGKTTLAVNLAGNLAKMKKRVLLLDTDQQGTALDWQAVREQEPLFTVAGLPRETVHKEIKNLSQGYDFVVLDSPPHSAALPQHKSLHQHHSYYLIPDS